MIKRSLAVLLTVCLCAFLAACGQASTGTASTDVSAAVEINAGEEPQAEDEIDLDSITLEKIGEANSRDAVFSRHENFATTVELLENDSDVVNADLYGVERYSMYSIKDEEYFDQSYFDADGSHVREEQILTRENQVYKTFIEDDEPYYTYSWLVAENADELPALWRVDYFAPASFPEGSDEKLLKVEDNSDGTITAYTSSSLPATPEVQSVPKDLENANMEYSYVLDSKTLEVEKITVNVVNDEKVIPFFEQVTQYDVEEPEAYKELSDNLKNTKIVASDGDDSKNITIIYDPGTDQEETYQQSFIKDFKIAMILKDGYGRYTDPEGKEPYKGSDGKSDLTIYALK